MLAIRIFSKSLCCTWISLLASLNLFCWNLSAQKMKINVYLVSRCQILPHFAGVIIWWGRRRHGPTSFIMVNLRWWRHRGWGRWWMSWLHIYTFKKTPIIIHNYHPLSFYHNFLFYYRLGHIKYSKQMHTTSLNRRKDTRPVKFSSSINIDISQPISYQFRWCQWIMLFIILVLKLCFDFWWRACFLPFELVWNALKNLEFKIMNRYTEPKMFETVGMKPYVHIRVAKHSTEDVILSFILWNNSIKLQTVDLFFASHPWIYW